MIYQWGVFVAALDPVQGSEQAGRRPVVVVSREPINQVLPVVNVVPITSLKFPDRRIYPNEALLRAGTGGLTTNSVALCYQIRTLDKSRLIEQLGVITDFPTKSRILNALRFQLEM